MVFNFILYPAWRRERDYSGHPALHPCSASQSTFHIVPRRFGRIRGLGNLLSSGIIKKARTRRAFLIMAEREGLIRLTLPLSILPLRGAITELRSVTRPNCSCGRSLSNPRVSSLSSGKYKNPRVQRGSFVLWRRERDSNPR